MSVTAINEIFDSFCQFQEESLTNRLFLPADIERLILKQTGFSCTEVGRSFEDRPIYLLRKGKGAKKVLLWSQMHGDEATGTMALFDVFNFLRGNHAYNGICDTILNNCTLYFVPLVNPDGAERFTRRNAQGIDINRDFLSQQSPEGKLLKQLRDDISPDYGFNLHDQSVTWSAGDTGNPATISLLAPAYDGEGSINGIRKRAMQIVARINEDIQAFIPNHVGLFDDEYEPRAFGDNFQAAGTSTVLIEAGGYPNDFEKQFIRKVYFSAILSGLISIADESYEQESLESYHSIVPNKKLHFSVLLRNCFLQHADGIYRVDIGLVAEETIDDTRQSTLSYVVSDIGDLTGRFGYQEVNAATYNLLLNGPLEIDKPANFVLQNQSDTILSFENGRISDKTSNFNRL